MDTIIIEDIATIRLIFSSGKLLYKPNTMTDSNYSIFRLIKKPLIVPDKLDKSSSTG
jgi:hypothetical protein